MSRILMVHPHDIYSTAEPWTIRITSLALELGRMGHDVRLVYFPLGPRHRGLLKRTKITEYETIPFNRSNLHMAENISKMVRLGRWADLIHFQKCFPHASLPSLISAYVNRKPIHYDWDDWEYGIYMFNPRSKLYAGMLNKLEAALPGLVDTVSVASDELKKMALAHRAKHVEKITVGADLDRFHPNNSGIPFMEKYGLKKPIVLYLGQLHGAQYAELMVKAAKIVSAKNPQASFVIVGGGADLNRLRSLASTLGVKIHFTGLVPDEEVDGALAAADVAVATFIDTKQQRCKSPLKIAEYMASGKAIVSSNVGEVPFMAGESAVLVNPGDAYALAVNISALLDDGDRRKAMGAAARKRAEELFSWPGLAKKLDACFRKSI